LGRRGGAWQDEVCRPTQQRLDLGPIAEDLSELRAGLPVRVVGARGQPADEQCLGSREQHAEIEREIGLLLGAAGEEHQAFAVVGQQVRDDIAAPPPPAVSTRLAEPIVVGVVSREATPLELLDERRLARPRHAREQDSHSARV
jgi:hypothetical protein